MGVKKHNAAESMIYNADSTNKCPKNQKHRALNFHLLSNTCSLNKDVKIEGKDNYECISNH